jgi:uncharacterized damage-inducible protein DinB
MTSNTDSVAPFYAGWEWHNALLIKAIRPLTEDQLALRPGTLPNQAWQIAAHIATNRVFWFHDVLHEGGDDLQQYADWEDEPAHPRSAAELVGALTATWDFVAECLARWTPAMLDESFERRRRNGMVVRHTRQWVTWHLLEHDIHHGGEISLILGMHGLEGLDV